MAGVQGSALAVAVSNAGGLGSLPCAMLDAGRHAAGARGAFARRRRSRSTSTSSVTRQPEIDRERDVRGEPRSRRTSRSSASTPPRPDAAAAAYRSTERRPTCSSEFQPPVVSFHFGLPSPDLLARVRAMGREDPVVRDDGRRGALARRARRRRGDRAGARGGRSPRDVPDRRPQHAGRHAGAGAADCQRGERAGDCRRRHCRRERRRERRWRSAPPACRSAPRTCCVPKRRRARCTARR